MKALKSLFMAYVLWFAVDRYAQDKRLRESVPIRSYIYAMALSIFVAGGFYLTESYYHRDVPHHANDIAKINTDKRILVVGDSHVEAYEYAFKKLFGKSASMKVVGGPCPPVPGTNVVYEVTNYRETNSNCTEFHKNIMKYAKDADVIMLASRWAYSTETNISQLIHNPWTRRTVLVDHDSFAKKEFSQQSAKAVFDDHLRIFLHKLVDAGKSVVILGQVPPLGADIRGCSESIYGKFVGCHPFYDLDKVRNRLRFTRSEFSKFSALPNVYYLDVYPLFCHDDDKYCSTEMNGHFLYRDDNHLSVDEYSSVLFAKMIHEQLVSIFDSIQLH